MVRQLWRHVHRQSVTQLLPFLPLSCSLIPVENAYALPDVIRDVSNDLVVTRIFDHLDRIGVRVLGEGRGVLFGMIPAGNGWIKILFV